MRYGVTTVPGVQHFHNGARIQHREYGVGTVVPSDRYTRADMVRVRFDGCGVVRVLASRVWSI